MDDKALARYSYVVGSVYVYHGWSYLLWLGELVRRLVVMQPHYLPYPGYFYLIDKSDVFVFLDDVQFSNQSWQQRNRIKTKDGTLWLTVPIQHCKKQQVSEVRIDYSKDWVRKHILSIKNSYSKARYFKQNFKYIEPVIKHGYDYLYDLNISLIRTICDILDIDFRYVLSSNIEYKTEKNDYLVYLCRFFNCDTYLSPVGSKDYLKPQLFKKNNINLEFTDYKPIRYNQCFDGFVPDMCILDLLLNMGEDSLDVIRG